jgi:predicted DNA-binding protein (UPF0251 family)
MFVQLDLDTGRMKRLVRAALRAWHTPGGTPASLMEGLLLVHEQRQALAQAAGSPSALRLATNHVLLSGIEALELLNAAEANALRSHYLDKLKTRALANRLKLSRDQANRLLNSATGRLAEILLHREHQARAAWIARQEEYLEQAQYTRLFGVERACAELAEHLLHAGEPWLFVIVGLGGIGKTALADALARAVLRGFVFEQVAWVRVNPQAAATPEQTFRQVVGDLTARLYPEAATDASPREQLARLHAACKQRPHLILVDNVEAVADADYLLERLAELINPSKIVLTSRARPSSQLTVYVAEVAELPEAEAAALLRHHAAALGETALAEAAESDLQSIYHVVGGNPLALRLVAGLARRESLAQLLDDLRHARPGEPAELYRRIYLKTWQTLSAPARALLLAMPLVAEVGGTPEHLRAASQLDEHAFWPALHELIGRSLLEVRGSLHAKRYGIHRLTNTFLHSDILRWPGEAAP